jgi:2-polyprenyl-3-methyl-5-hydroxy-6-metoxy-1,4-benzoquinol methylase
MDDFYDRLAPLYDLIFVDWDASMEQQAGHLAAIIGERWGADVQTILDVACGIGTQSIGLARKGFEVTASDLSAGAVERAKVEASRRDVEISFSVCDMRVAYDHLGRQFDVVIACDNAIPHLLSDDEIQMAFRQMFACTRPGGGCLVTSGTTTWRSAASGWSSRTACGTGTGSGTSSSKSGTSRATSTTWRCTSWSMTAAGSPRHT